MKKLIIFIPVLFLLGCSPTPMSDKTAKAFEACLAKGWQPQYFSNGAQIDFTCSPADQNVLKFPPVK